MNSYKCNFCTHQVGPIKPTPSECVECRCGNHFQLKTKLHPNDIIAWEKHQRFDRFIDDMSDRPVVLWQRELLHKCLDNRPVYYRGCSRSTERAVIDIFLMLFDEHEKEKEKK